MKIHAYRVEPAELRGELLATLESLHARPHQDRTSSHPQRLRLDSYSANRSYVLADFAHARIGHGPGKLSSTAPIADIKLAEGEVFGEDTGVCFDRDSGYAALQFNQVGPRARGIAEYLSAANRARGGRAGFTFAPVLTRDAEARLGRIGLIKAFDVKVAIGGASSEQFEQGASVSQMLERPIPTGTETIEVIVKAGRQRRAGLSGSDVRGLISDFTSRFGGELQKAKVEGKTPEGNPEIIDLLEEFVSDEVAIRVGRGSRIGQSERWQALQDRLSVWLESGRLQVVRAP